MTQEFKRQFEEGKWYQYRLNTLPSPSLYSILCITENDKGALFISRSFAEDWDLNPKKTLARIQLDRGTYMTDGTTVIPIKGLKIELLSKSPSRLERFFSILKYYSVDNLLEKMGLVYRVPLPDPSIVLAQQKEYSRLENLLRRYERNDSKRLE